ncbi:MULTISPECIES: hypothetical protein [Sandaracinus]|uniref:hypothetical protein n=1 Tax=Sandaracinus TaxID=1055688 RepID=UPI0019D46245|nr:MULTISPECIES: hypothetical protein [Sandaracinus]UJR87359.1 Hypothetical protein I5071_1510 [Sandaracinus amylolyticus]
MGTVVAILVAIVSAVAAWALWPSLRDGFADFAAMRGRRIVPRSAAHPSDLPIVPPWVPIEACDAVMTEEEPGSPYRVSGETRAVALTSSTPARAIRAASARASRIAARTLSIALLAIAVSIIAFVVGAFVVGAALLVFAALFAGIAAP